MFPGIVALNAGVEFLLSTSIEDIHQKNLLIFNKVISFMQNLPEVVIYGSQTSNNRSPSVISFNIKGYSPEDLGYILQNSFDIVTRSGLHCAPLVHKAVGSYPHGSLRASWSCFTSEKDIDSFLEAINQICKAAGVL